MSMLELVGLVLTIVGTIIGKKVRDDKIDAAVEKRLKERQ